MQDIIITLGEIRSRHPLYNFDERNGKPSWLVSEAQYGPACRSDAAAPSHCYAGHVRWIRPCALLSETYQSSSSQRHTRSCGIMPCNIIMQDYGEDILSGEQIGKAD